MDAVVTYSNAGWIHRGLRPVQSAIGRIYVGADGQGWSAVQALHGGLFRTAGNRGSDRCLLLLRPGQAGAGLAPRADGSLSGPLLRSSRLLSTAVEAGNRQPRSADLRRY